MAYWHIRLHPSSKNQERWEENFNEKELLTKISLIGMGVSQNSPRLDAFKNEMKNGDIVLVRRNKKPIALVQVLDGVKDRRQNAYNQLDWFRYARKVKVLDFADNREDFTSASLQVLRKSDDEKTTTYKYIDDWYNEVRPIDDTYHFSKIKEVYIEKYKMFNQFTLNLCNEEGKPLPIIVIAGKNGTGKTSLIEYLSEYSANSDTDNLKILKKSENNNFISENMKKGESGIIETREEYKNSIQYIPIALDESSIKDIKTIEKLFVDYWLNQVKFHNKRNDEITKDLQKFITESFDGLDLGFTYSAIDENDNIFFQNKNGKKFKISELSTGEQILLSRVLYLFLKGYKNKVILIDEPELSLHPSWQNKILKIYENFAIYNDCQIIITTHSPHIISSSKNEYLRILRKKENGNIEVINDLKAHGRDINSILFDVMGEVAYRSREFNDKIDKLYIAIDDRKFKEVEERLQELKKDYGAKDKVIMEAEMLISVFSNEE